MCKSAISYWRMIAPHSEQFFVCFVLFFKRNGEHKAKCDYFAKIEWWVRGHFFTSFIMYFRMQKCLFNLVISNIC